MDSETINEILESLKITLGVTEEAEIAQLTEILKDAITEIQEARKYPSDMSASDIEDDMQKFISNVKKLTKYDFAQIGAEFEETHNENGTNRAYMDRRKCLDGVVPYCRMFQTQQMCVLRVLCLRDILNARVCVYNLVVGDTLKIKRGSKMATYITIFISALSVSFAIYMGLRNNRKADDKDIAENVARNTRIDVKLEEITSYVKEIRNDNTDTKRQLIEIGRQLALVEASTKSAHHRIDKIEREEGRDNV